MNELNDKTKLWLTNKLNGNFAENICAIHFESLGYAVEKIGIENIAPSYTKNSNFLKENFVKKHLNRTPDFIVSKDKEHAVFVEVKFNSTINDSQESFYDYGSKLIIRYKNIIFKSKFIDDITDDMSYQQLYNFIIHKNKDSVFKDDIKIYFYVVVPHSKYYDSYVFLFMPHTINTKNYGWRSANNIRIDEISRINEFSLRYKEIIKPFLENIFNNKNSK